MEFKDKDVQQFRNMSKLMKEGAEQLDIVSDILEKESKGEATDEDANKVEAAMGIYIVKMIELSKCSDQTINDL